MTNLEQTRHMWHVAGNLWSRSKSKVACFKLWRQNVKQRLATLEQSEVVACKREFNWPKALCFICCFLRVGEMLQSTLTQLSVANSLAEVYSSSGQAQLIKGNSWITALCLGCISEGTLQASTFLRTSTAHLLDCFFSLWVLRQTKWKQHTIAQKTPNL